MTYLVIENNCCSLKCNILSCLRRWSWMHSRWSYHAWRWSRSDILGSNRRLINCRHISLRYLSSPIRCCCICFCCLTGRKSDCLLDHSFEPAKIAAFAIFSCTCVLFFLWCAILDLISLWIIFLLLCRRLFYFFMLSSQHVSRDIHWLWNCCWRHNFLLFCWFKPIKVKLFRHFFHV